MATKEHDPLTLMLTCRGAAYASTGICRSLNVLPLRNLTSLAPDPTLSGLGAALTNGFDTPMGTQDGLYGASTAAVTP